MRDGIRVLVTIGLGLVVVTGCSGGGAAATGATASKPPAAASQAAAATSAASEAAAPTKAPGGGTGTGGGVCDLITKDELKGILGVEVTTRVLTGPPDTCDVQADGAPIVAFVVTPSGGGAVYGAYAADPGATTISGMGDKAAFAPGAGLLVILKGDTLFSMSAFDPTKTPEQRLEQMKKIGAIAAGRM